MQKLLYILLISSLSIGTSFGQETSVHFSKNNAVKINPFGFGKATFQIAYEHYFKDRKSSILLAPSIILLESNDESKEGWEAMGQYRFYLSHLRKDRQKTFLGVHNYGFYAGLYGLYSSYNEEFLRGHWDQINDIYVNEEYEKEVETIEGGALLGIQIDVTKRILLDFYIGGGIKNANLTDTYLDNNPSPDYYESYGVFDPEYKGVKPKLGLLVGISF